MAVFTVCLTCFLIFVADSSQEETMTMVNIDNILALNRSLEFNLKSRTFNELFPELRKEAEDEVK